jgi:hypothetical protein
VEKKIRWLTDHETLCIDDPDVATETRSAKFKKGETTIVEMMDDVDNHRLFRDKARNCIFRVKSDAKLYDFVD